MAGIGTAATSKILLLVSPLLLFVCVWLAATPSSAKERDPLLSRADSLQHVGMFDSALVLYNHFLAQHPQDSEGLYGRGILSLRRNDLEAGMSDLQKSLLGDPGCAKCYVGLGRGAVLQGENAKGLEYAERAIKVDSSEAGGWNLRGHLQSSRSAAVEDFSRAIELEPDNVSYLIDRGNFYFANYYRSMAEQDINKALTLDSLYAPGYYLRAHLYLQEGEQSGGIDPQGNARDVFENVDKAIRLGYDDAGAFCLRARMNEALGRVDSAIADYTICAERSSSDEAYKSLHARAILRFGKEDMDGACEDLDKVLELIGSDTAARAIAIIPWNDHCDSSAKGYYYHRGIAEYNLNNFVRSIEWYDKGLKKFPESVIMHDFRGNSALALGRYELAAKEYQYVLARFDQCVDEYIAASSNMIPPSMGAEVREKMLLDLYGSYAIALVHMEKFDEALAVTDSAIALVFRPAALYNFRGLIRLWSGNLKEAEKDFELALSIEPNSPDALANRGIVYLAEAVAPKTQRMITIGFGIPTHGEKSVSLPWPSNNAKGNIDLDLVRRARTDLDRALSLNPEMEQSYEFRAYCRKLLGERDYCDDMKRARQLGPDSGLGLTPECR